MSYSDPLLPITYSWDSIDFGAGNTATSIKGPSGMAGRVREIVVVAEETFTNDTTPAYVRLGTGSDADAYVQADLGTTADTNTFVASQDDTDWAINDRLPADTQIEVAFVAPTGGTPAGIGNVFIMVDWGA